MPTTPAPRGVSARMVAYYTVALLVVLAAVIIGQLVAAATADAARRDATTPGCISHREWLEFERGTMAQVEARNGVTGLGQVVVWSDGGNHVVKAYPWCGHEPADSIQVSYDRNTRGQYMANFVSEYDM